MATTGRKKKRAEGAANEPSTGLPQVLTLERRAAYRFSILANLSGKALAGMYTRRFGLTMADWKTMAIIGHHEPIHPGAIAARTSMVPEGVSRALERLVKKDMVDRSADEHDRRRVVVTLTKTGRKAFDEIEAVRSRMEEDFLKVLTRTEREALFSILDRLDAHAHEALAAPDAWVRYTRAG